MGENKQTSRKEGDSLLGKRAEIDGKVLSPEKLAQGTVVCDEKTLDHVSPK